MYIRDKYTLCWFLMQENPDTEERRIGLCRAAARCRPTVEDGLGSSSGCRLRSNWASASLLLYYYFWTQRYLGALFSAAEQLQWSIRRSNKQLGVTAPGRFLKATFSLRLWHSVFLQRSTHVWLFCLDLEDPLAHICAGCSRDKNKSAFASIFLPPHPSWLHP